MMKWDDVNEVEMAVWYMRLVDQPRGSNRAILDRLYNGEPPENEEEAEQNQSQVNRNFLEGTNILTQARTQWNNAFLKQKNYFSVTLDSGPAIKRQEWSHSITSNINRQLKKSRQQMEQTRAEGASVILHGIGPSTFKDRRCPILSPLPIASLMIPSETTIEFDNLEYFAVFREWTPSQLYELTHGPKRDPGWNMEAVQAAWEYAREIILKDTNASALQYMPERWQELKKQDTGYLGSDAAPTVDAWDFFFRNSRDGDGWYRRIFLDWGVAITSDKDPMPQSRNGKGDKEKYGGFLYTSGKRKYGNAVSEILQCQFGDCSAVMSPPRYHAVRGLGWMLWGVADILNRMHCRFTENVFMQFLWWFRVASGQEMARVKKAMFENMGVIPAGIQMITANERFVPNAEIVQNAFEQNRQLLGDYSSTFTKGRNDLGEEETATGTMAKVHTMNAMVSGMMTLAYEYSKHKYMEQSRRFCIKNSPYKMVQDFRLACFKDHVPEEMLDSSRWDIEPDRALGDGNKILELATVQFLQGIRKNLTPDSQRLIDHISIVSATDQPRLAEDLAPVENQQKLSPGMHDAQLASDRIMRGLPFTPSPDMVPEDYITVWMGDLTILIQQLGQGGNVTMDKILELGRLVQAIQKFISTMAAGEKERTPKDETKAKTQQFNQALQKLIKPIKMLAQQIKPQQNGGADAQKLQLEQAKGQIKMRNMIQSHALRSAGKQASFEMEQQREDARTKAEIQRENVKTAQELIHEQMRSLRE